MGAKRMTLKQAAEFLATTEYVFGLPALKKAAINGKLKARLESAPVPYYTTTKEDVLAWASNDEMHKSGRKVE